MTEPNIVVQSEIGRLRRVLIHAPDDGIGKIFPLKAQDWLYDDIIDLQVARNREYKPFLSILYSFLDPEKLSVVENAEAMDPKSANFPRSDYVIDIQWLLSDILNDTNVRAYVVSSVCALESVSYCSFLQLLALPSRQLANTLISGTLPNEKMIFPPVPNIMMTRDIAMVVNHHILISRPAKEARKREAIIMRFIVYNHPLFAQYRDKVIDLTEDDTFFLLDEELQDDCKVTMEGGDFLMVAPNHLAIGVSERTTMHACKKLIRILFQKQVVEKVTLVNLPSQRYCMHLDTVLTQVSRGMWVVFSPICKETGLKSQSSYDREFQRAADIRIEQYNREQDATGKTISRTFDCIEKFIEDVTRNDLKWSGPIDLVMSGGGKFPDAWREQWTDACNVFAVKEGVILTYDRNRATIEAFRQRGMTILTDKELLDKLKNKELDIDGIHNTVITFPSSELSRARGGAHCMTQPLLRDTLSEQASA